MPLGTDRPSYWLSRFEYFHDFVGAIIHYEFVVGLHLIENQDRGFPSAEDITEFRLDVCSADLIFVQIVIYPCNLH
jgi:hypothetical protein